jgi:hypothetical protein
MIIKDVNVEGQLKKAIFDKDSVVSYVTERALPKDAVCINITPITSRLEGTTHRLTRRCFISGTIEGCAFDLDAFVIDKLGSAKEKGNVELDFLIGATTMEEWAVNVNPKNQIIDLSGLKKREFLSF